MKKKFFTLLTLMLCVCSGAWAETISCSATVPSGNEGTFSETEGIAQTNCILKWSGLQGGSNIVRVNDVDYYKLGSDNAYVQLILNSGSFMAGDVLTATVTSNGGSSAKTVNVKVGSNATSTVSVKGTETKNITYTLTSADIETDGSIKIFRNTNGSNLRVAVFSVTGTRVSEKYTVTFNAGSNGSCITTSLTEESAGAGVTLPAVTANSGYTFNGWFTAATQGTKVGDAGSLYSPTSNITLYAQYSANSAPTISFDMTNVSTNRGTAVTFTATLTGSPAPTVTWYQSETATTSGGTEKGTGATYSPDVTAEGIFYYYAVASNGISPDATSELITLTVNNPDVTLSGNNYYVAVNENAVANQNIICDDITMQFVNTKGGFNAGTKDETVKSIVSGFVAQISGDNSSNGWSVKFTPSKAGSLKVGVVINKDKTFSISNVTSFSYQAKNPDASETIETNTWAPSAKIYGVVTIDVEPGTEYSFSVAGSKMGLYGFEFTPADAISIKPAYDKTTYVTKQALDFSNVSDLKAYVATGASAAGVTTAEVGAVPAGTPLLLKGTANTEYSVPVVAEASAPATNLLCAGDGTTVFDGTTYDYLLAADGKFYQIGSGTIAVGKAYLHLDSNPAGARSLSVIFADDMTTGIETIANETKADNTVYNLGGQRVAQPTKGLYIVNGKKIIK